MQRASPGGAGGGSASPVRGSGFGVGARGSGLGVIFKSGLPEVVFYSSFSDGANTTLAEVDSDLFNGLANLCVASKATLARSVL